MKKIITEAFSYTLNYMMKLENFIHAIGILSLRFISISTYLHFSACYLSHSNIQRFPNLSVSAPIHPKNIILTGWLTLPPADNLSNKVLISFSFLKTRHR